MKALYGEDLASYLEDEAAAAGTVDDVIKTMEQRAATDNFPIVGRSVGRLLELQARAIGAQRVMEMGSGFGYSAYWFARAVGPEGSVVCTDLEEENATAAEEYLTAAGVWPRITFRVGDALNALISEDGNFDIIYNDVDKIDYPECWRSAAERIRIGGLYICDNVLWSGKVADASADDEATTAIREHNRLVATDPRYFTAIAPLRDGVMIALRTT